LSHADALEEAELHRTGETARDIQMNERRVARPATRAPDVRVSRKRYNPGKAIARATTSGFSSAQELMSHRFGACGSEERVEDSEQPARAQ
jgi:hypothetical protein